MRKFSSYGPVNPKLHYYAPRQQLIDQACEQLMGENSTEGGHYITVWAPRQTGKTWIMQQVHQRLKAEGEFEVAITTLQSAKSVTTPAGVLNVLVTNLRNWFKQDFPDIERWDELRTLFTADYFSKPVILILDEFDALEENLLNQCANEFRSIYTERLNEADKPTEEKQYLLHGLALIGVRSVLGVENVTGSPFNVQRSLHIPNLTYEEVAGMFHWYERESGQPVTPEVIDRLYYELRGQPGLTGWFGELLTETYNKTPDQPITMSQFDEVYGAALAILPNNNILNIISKAKQEPYRQVVLELFKTDEKLQFRYDESDINYLYLNGVVAWEQEGTNYYLKFPCPFVQKRLFNYFAHDLFNYVGKLYAPLEDLSDTVTETSLNIPNLLRRYEIYLQQNRHWLFKNAPRRHDLRLYEAVYHFNFYMYLFRFLRPYGVQVWPEFPTGNGEVDILLNQADYLHALEVKSFTVMAEFRKAREQAARYGKSLNLSEVWLVLFIEAIDEANREKYQVAYHDQETGVTVKPVFVVIGAMDQL